MLTGGAQPEKEATGLKPADSAGRWRRRLKGLLADSSRTKKAYLNAVASGLEYAAQFSVSFVVNPILVGGLGSFLYGVWQVLSRLKGYLSAASGRPTEAMKWAVAHRQSSPDAEEKRRLMGAAVVVWMLFLPVMGAGGFALAWYAPGLLKVPPASVTLVRVAAVILILDLTLTSLVNLPESVLRGENLGYKRMGLTTLLVLLQGSMVAAAVLLGMSLVGVASAMLVNTLLNAAFFWWVARSNVPWFGIALPRASEVKQFLGLSGWFLVWRLVMQTMLGSDVVVLGILASAESVTSYTLTKQIPESLISLVAIVMGGITPGLGGMIGAGDLKRVNRVRGEFLAGSWLLAAIAGTTTLLWNPSFVRLWVGKQYYSGPTALLLIMVMIVQFVLIRNDANIIDLTLDLRRKVLLGAVSAGLAVLFGGVLLKTFNLGISGLCLGFMAGRLILSLGYPTIIGRLLGVSLAAQMRSALRPVLVTIVLFGLAASFGRSLVAPSWPLLVLAAGLTVLVISPLAFFAGLPREQRGRLLRRLRAMLPGRSAEPEE